MAMRANKRWKMGRKLRGAGILETPLWFMISATLRQSSRANIKESRLQLKVRNFLTASCRTECYVDDGELPVVITGGYRQSFGLVG